MPSKKSFESVKGKISEKEFLEKVEEKIREFGGLLDISSASMFVAYEMTYGSPVNIGELDENSRNVVVEGTVRKIISSRTFEKNGVTGSVANIVIGDDSGEIRAVLWDRYAEMVKDRKIKEGTALRIKGYLKKGASGIELHAGKTGDVEILSGEEHNVEKIPITFEFDRISDLTARKVVNLKGFVTGIGRIKFFSKRGKEGRVSEIHISDDSGRVRVVLWDDQVEILRRVDIGSEVIILDGFTKMGYDGTIEVHAGRTTKIEVSDGKFRG